MPKIIYLSDGIGKGTYSMWYNAVKIGTVKQNKNGTFTFTTNNEAHNLSEHKGVDSLVTLENRIKKEISKKWIKAKRSKFATEWSSITGTDKRMLHVDGVVVGIAKKGKGDVCEFVPTPDLRLTPKVGKVNQLVVDVALELEEGTKPSNWDNAEVERLVRQQKKITTKKHKSNENLP